MWKLCVVDDESNRTDVDLVRSEYSLGRAEESTVRLTERNISRNHARLFHDDDEQWWIEDNGSYTGSFVNGERVQGRKSISHGDTVQLGDYRLELTDTLQEDAGVAANTPSVESLVDRLTVVQGPGVGTVHELTEHKLLVGRGEECKIALDDASVSRVHVEILRTEHGLMILDQGSSNGLRINGVDLPSAMLRAGDVVELGDVRLKFTPAGVEDVDSPVLMASTSHVPDALGSSGGARSGRPVYWYAIGAVAVAALFFAFSGGDDDLPTVATSRMGEEVVAKPSPMPGYEATLKEAASLAESGAAILAHRKLSSIPASSELRQRPEFQRVEQKWADALLKAASDSPDVNERRVFLQRVAQTPGVGSDRQARAAELLAQMDAENEALDVVDVSELPTAHNAAASAERAVRNGKASASAGAMAAKAKSGKTSTPPRRPASRKAAVEVKPRASASARNPAEKSSAPAQNRPVKKTATPPASKEPKAAPKSVPAPKPVSAPELIRDNPF